MLLKVNEVAMRLSLSVSKVYELVERRTISHHKIGGAIRISEQQLTEYLEMTKRERAEPQPRESRLTRPRLRHIKL